MNLQQASEFHVHVVVNLKYCSKHIEIHEGARTII